MLHRLTAKVPLHETTFPVALKHTHWLMLVPPIDPVPASAIDPIINTAMKTVTPIATTLLSGILVSLRPAPSRFCYGSAIVTRPNTIRVGCMNGLSASVLKNLKSLSKRFVTPRVRKPNRLGRR